jgi:hypothetical protein
MVMNKRGQFFLLAAVIIAAVVISLGISANRATVNREPGNFYDFSYEVSREVGAVIDYEIYSDIRSGDRGGAVGDDKLEEFVDLLAEDIRDKNPSASFKFVYGNNTNLVEKNFGGDDDAPGSVCFSGSCQDVDGGDRDGDDTKRWTKTEIGDNEEFEVEVKGHKFSFPISRHKQVFFIMQKDVDDESFVAVG